ncbi:MAG: TIR domain-containing protein [Phycisphaerae bacterium]|nr:TIR domain-containing protein [Phycisphaerae bacterium]
MTGEFPHDVFVSYSHHNRKWVRNWLLPRLHEAGLTVCIDVECFDVGAPSMTEMERAVEQSAKTLLVLTPQYLESESCEFEIALAQRLDPAARRRRVLPLLLQKCDLPPRISGLVYADFTQAEQWERQLQKVIGAITEQHHATDVQGGLIPEPPQPYFAHPHPLQMNFTGRVRERRMLTEWLTTESHGVLALIALGGMGKSAVTWVWARCDVLGREVAGLADVGAAHDCRVPDANRPEGVMWWSFYRSEASFRDFVDASLTYVSGGRIAPAARDTTHDRVVTLVQLLQQRSVLLVLDGFERELRAYAGLSAAYQQDAVAQEAEGDTLACIDPHAADFLRAVASTPMQGRVLLTSRLMPRELEDLAGCRPEKLTELAPADAVAFFHAQGVTKGTRVKIQAVCERYGYHALALRLLSSLIAKDHRQPRDIEAATRHDVSDDLKARRHHVLEVAYNALANPSRELLSAIAAFRSPMAYEAVAVFNTFESDEAFEATLDELIDSDLLLFEPEHGSYDLHPIVRQYAYSRLTDKVGTHTRLRDYFAAILPSVEAKLRSVEDLSPIIELYHHTVCSGRCDDAARLFYGRLHYPLYYLFCALPTYTQLLSALFPDGEDRPPRLEGLADQARTQNSLACAYALFGEPRRSVTLFEASVRTYEGAGGRVEVKEGHATTLSNLGVRRLVFGEMAAAEKDLRRSIELSHQIDETTNKELREAIGRRQLGRLLCNLGAFGKAEQELGKAMAVFRNQDNPREQCLVCSYNAFRALLMRDPEGALDSAREARELANAVQGKDYRHERLVIRCELLLGSAKVGVACIHRDQRNELLTEAAAHLTEALTCCRRANLVEHEMNALLARARWHHAKGDAEQARRDANEASSIADRCEYRLAQADTHNFMALLAIDHGDRELAAEHAKIAYERAWCDGLPYCYKPALDEAKRLLDELCVAPPGVPQ